MSASTILPMHIAPQLKIYDPSGQAIPHHPELLPGPISNKDKDKDKERKKEESPPMFKAGDRLAIVCGDDYYHLPREMNPSLWAGDMGDLYNFRQLPFCHWPDKVSFPSSVSLNDV